jgi:hypothetical protein
LVLICYERKSIVGWLLICSERKSNVGCEQGAKYDTWIKGSRLSLSASQAHAYALEGGSREVPASRAPRQRQAAMS